MGQFFIALFCVRVNDWKIYLMYNKVFLFMKSNIEDN